MFRESLESGSKTAALGMSMVKISNETTWSTYLASRLETNGKISDISETLIRLQMQKKREYHW